MLCLEAFFKSYIFLLIFIFLSMETHKDPESSFSFGVKGTFCRHVYPGL